MKMIDEVLQRVPVFVLVVFRLAGMMLMAPVFSSPRTPKRVKALLAIVLAFGISGGVEAVALPDTAWEMAVGIGGEMMFGAAMGMLVSATFVAGQWAGEMIGMQMGLNMSEVFDPSMGSAGSIMGDVYYFMALAVFLTVGGHHQLLHAVHASFKSLPLLSLGVNDSLLQVMIGTVQSAMVLAIRLAAPVLVTMLVVDLALGLAGRAMPQLNILQAGMSMRSLVGLAVVIVALQMSVGLIEKSVVGSLDQLRHHWTPPATATG